MGIGGHQCVLRFQRLKHNRTPLLISIGQWRELGASIDINERTVTFARLFGARVPLHFSQKVT